MKKVYFVRHGESEVNTNDIRQTGTFSLTDYGRKQSDCLAEHVAELSVDIIISSTMNRSQETAEIISKKTGKRVDGARVPAIHSDFSHGKYRHYRSWL